MNDSWTRRLLYRWFVEYNPFYVASAGCVVVGVNLISSAIGGRGLLALLGVPAIAEAYAWALIASAAWLTRTGSRRPAVMLALLVAIYQCDPTLHSETCAYMGALGVPAAAAWLASFVGKLYALGSALRLRLSRSALAVPTFGAIGLLTIPRCFGALDGFDLTALIACFVFALFAAAFWTRREVTSTVELDAWGHTVLERGARATWLIWAALALGRALFWFDELGLRSIVLVPVAMLLCTRWMRSELSVWSTAISSMLLAALAMPGLFSAIAIMVAITLVLRAWRQPTLVTPAEPLSEPSAPYRTGTTPPRAASAPRPWLTFTRAEPAAITRLSIGALAGVYLSLWTFGWQGGSWPAHNAVLDALGAVALLGIAYRTRSVFAIAPVPASCLHLAIQVGLISAPETALQWGVTSVATGFVLLASSLFATWRIRKAVAAAGASDDLSVRHGISLESPPG